MSSDSCHLTEDMEIINVKPNIFQISRYKRKRIQEEDNPELSHPSTSKKPPPKSMTNIINVNKFDNLEIESLPEPSPETDQDDENHHETTPNTINKKLKKPPPIHIYGRFDHQKLFDDTMVKHIGNDYSYKFIGKDEALIYTNSADQHKKARQLLATGKVQFHTYSLKEEKTHGFVLKGLCQKVEIDEIKADLQEQGVKTINIFPMKGMPIYAPAYLIITEADVKLSFLQQHVKKIGYTIIKWERHINNKKITQCHRCQKWGHATSNCNINPACLKCGQGHWTRDCQKPVNVPPRCANCEENHLSNSTKCIAYRNAMEKIQKNQVNKKTYVDAPASKENYWEIRKNQRIHENLSQQSTTITPQNNLNNISLENTGMGNLQELTNELNKLNSFFNLNKMINLVKQLNSKLASCNDNVSKFLVFNNFISELNSLNLS